MGIQVLNGVVASQTNQTDHNQKDFHLNEKIVCFWGSRFAIMVFTCFMLLWAVVQIFNRRSMMEPEHHRFCKVYR